MRRVEVPPHYESRNTYLQFDLMATVISLALGIDKGGAVEIHLRYNSFRKALVHSQQSRSVSFLVRKVGSQHGQCGIKGM